MALNGARSWSALPSAGLPARVRVFDDALSQSRVGRIGNCTGDQLGGRGQPAVTQEVVHDPPCDHSRCRA